MRTCRHTTTMQFPLQPQNFRGYSIVSILNQIEISECPSEATVYESGLINWVIFGDTNSSLGFPKAFPNSGFNLSTFTKLAGGILNLEYFPKVLPGFGLPFGLCLTIDLNTISDNSLNFVCVGQNLFTVACGLNPFVSFLTRSVLL
jgi:hypothetical protein